MTMQQNSFPAHNGLQPASGQQVGGMKCPACQGFIPISVHQLLHEGGIVCPHCGLSMTINKAQSKRALEALEKVEAATRKVRETETFKR